MNHRTVLAPPGQTIKKLLAERQMSQKEFATRMDLSQKHVSHLINGSVQLTPEVAYRLEMVLGVPANYWNRLEAAYREELVRTEHARDILEDRQLLDRLPLKELNQWVALSEDPEEQVVQLRQFFEVSKLSILLEERLDKEGIPYVSSKKEFLAMAKTQHEKWESRERTEYALDEADRHAREDTTRLSHEEVFSNIRNSLTERKNA